MPIDTNFILISGGALATAVFSVVAFMIKDVYTKVGELGALRERVRNLEAHADDSKKVPEAVIRLEEQMKNLIIKVEMLTAALIQDKVNKNG